MLRSPSRCMARVASWIKAALTASAHRMVALGGRLRAAQHRRRRRRAELDLLLQINSRLLADIGLLRSDLDAIVSGVVPIEQIGLPVAERTPVRSLPALVVVSGGRGALEGCDELDAAA